MEPGRSGARWNLHVNKVDAFRRTIDLCFRAHPYYRDVFQKLHLAPTDFQTPDDLIKLPVTDKAMWVAQPEAFRLTLVQEDVSVEERTLWEIVYTTGTSGRPTPFYDTAHDHYARMAHLKRMAELAGIRSSDTVVNLFPLTSIPHQGFLTVLYASLGVGAKMLAPFTGRGYPEFVKGRTTDDAIALVEQHQPTILWGVATFVRRLLIRAQELGTDLSSVRLVFAMGEPCPKVFRDDLRRRLATLGASTVAVQNGYGFTEMQGPTYECREEGGYHVPLPELFHFEILHPETLTPVRPGEEGLVVVSHMNRRGTVLLRYRVGDVSAMRDDPCPYCGRSVPRFVQPPVRVGRLVRIKGTLVDPALIEEEVARIAAIQEYQCVVAKADPTDPHSMDALTIRVACDPAARDAIAASLPGDVRRAVEVTPLVEFVDRDELLGDDAQYKFKRFVVRTQ
jgi:phenylacetate-coenzyme A ligase PaaK-like adenylate-forming protein